MPSFAFADLPTALPLAAGQSEGRAAQAGSLPLTVRNTTRRRLTGRATVLPERGAQPTWFALEGAPPTEPGTVERDFEPEATQTLTVKVAVPEGAPPGAYRFRVRVAAEDDIDNDFAESGAVAFDVAPWQAAPLIQQRPRLPWWAVAAAVAVLVLAVTGAWWFWPREQQVAVPRAVGRPALEAMADVMNLGLVLRLEVTREANQPDAVITAQDPAPGTPVARGSEVRLTANDRPAGGGTGPVRPGICQRIPGICNTRLTPHVFSDALRRSDVARENPQEVERTLQRIRPTDLRGTVQPNR